VTKLSLLFSAASLVVAASLQAQFSFTDHTDLLASSSSSGAPMAIVDLNGDGRDDLVRVHQTDRLFIDYQNEPGQPFSAVDYGDLPRGSIWAVCAADVDRNGFNDIFIGPSSGGALLLKAGASGQSYTSIELPDRDIFVQGTIFADFDNDGNIDLFACDDNDDNHPYKNDGAGGFSLQRGLIGASLPSSVSSGNYAVIETDYDNDGHRDIYLSKCRLGVTSSTDRRRINRLFRNDGSNNYTDEGPAVGLADGEQSWCSDFADIDNDGDMDCFILNHGAGTSRLLENDGSGGFTDIGESAGLGDIDYFGIQALFRDFDNDTHIDLLVTATDLGGSAATYRIYRNNGDKTFTEVPDILRLSGGTPISHLHSCALGDLNHDGFVDIFGGRGTGYNGTSASLRDLLFLNNPNENHYLVVQLKGRTSNPNAIGARLELHGDWGVQLREVRAGEGYGIQNSLTKIFGLGDSTSISKLVVRWPSGIIEEILAPDVDQFLTLREGDSLGDEAFTLPVISSPLEARVVSGDPFSYRVSTSNLSLSYELGQAPVGMTIDAESGVLSWISSGEGIQNVEIRAVNPAGTTTETLAVTVSLAPPPPDFATAVNNPELVFLNTEDPWFVQSQVSRQDGQALQSGDIDDDGRSYVETSVDGPGELEFWWRVSSEANYDELVFRVDGAQVQNISGETDWELVSYRVPEGSHRLRWSYEKDGSISSNDDAGYLDEIFWAATDSDGDGLPDDWERENFGSLSSEGGDDPDGDLSDNRAEWSASTDPNDATSSLRILQITRDEEGGSAVIFQSVPGKRYVVEASETMEDFKTVTSPITADGVTTDVPVQLYVPGSTGEVIYVAPDAEGRVFVPNQSIGDLWKGGNEEGFTDSGGDQDWINVTQGIGYDQNQTRYDPFIGTDLQTQMYRERATAYLRIPFEITNPAAITSLSLDVRYDDAFAAWINGVPVARGNTSDGELDWSSTAPSSRPDSQAVEYAAFDLGDYSGALRAGGNILALQGLNRSTSNRDFLLQVRMRGNESEILRPSGYYFRVRVVE
tara:strand:- start:3989 stop:7102 length:3114 start_codon:yes stop_codon:yes gene_type:complete